MKTIPVSLQHASIKSFFLVETISKTPPSSPAKCWKYDPSYSKFWVTNLSNRADSLCSQKGQTKPTSATSMSCIRVIFSMHSWQPVCSSHRHFTRSTTTGTQASTIYSRWSRWHSGSRNASFTHCRAEMTMGHTFWPVTHDPRLLTSHDSRLLQFPVRMDGVEFNAPLDTISHFGGGLLSQSLDWYWQTKQYRKIQITNSIQIRKSKQPKIQPNKTTLVPLPLTTLGQETRWAYSTTLRAQMGLQSGPLSGSALEIKHHHCNQTACSWNLVNLIMGQRVTTHVTHSDSLTHLTRDPLTHCHLCCRVSINAHSSTVDEMV